jgi:hypothetical protein
VIPIYTDHPQPLTRLLGLSWNCKQLLTRPAIPSPC